MMRCAKWDITTGDCLAAVRNEGYAFLTEAYLMTPGTPICQFPWANPISSYYSNGSSCPDWAECPDPMGSFAPGEQFTIMWWARNHAIDDEDPATIFLYLSPTESLNQGSDVTEAQMEETLICSAPYESCNGQNGNTVPCWVTCTFPQVPEGIYTMWWKWPWQGVIYTTCADLTVTAGSSDPPVAPPATTKKSANAQVTTASKLLTTDSKPLTTGSKPLTTGRKQSTSTSTTTTTTTGSASIPTTGSTSSSAPCTLGDEQCVSTSTYISCYRASSTTLAWSPPRSCQPGLVCRDQGTSHVICDWP